jgi:hydroxymethylbilane synthase
LLRSLKIGSRKSSLAKLQSYLVKKKLLDFFPDLSVEFYFKESAGDIDLTSPLWKMSGKGVFTKDFREDLLSEKIDLVIHSWKDLDLTDDPATEVLSVLERADERDILLFKKDYPHLPVTKIFSSSPRREYNLKKFFASAFPSSLANIPIEFFPVRGNILTRLTKWREDKTVSGIIIAKAALDRLLEENFPESNLDEYVSTREYIRECLDLARFMILPISENPNAPAQGALACEIKKGRADVREIIEKLQIESVKKSVMKEREILHSYGGGCHQKIGVAIKENNAGSYCSIRGLTDSGEVLNTNTFIQNNSLQEKSSNEIFQFPNSKEQLEFHREIIPIETLPDYTIYFITRKEAWSSVWNSQVQNKILWTSGIKTWFALAKEDLWISGSQDSFGESEEMRLDLLLPNFTSTKLTHADSEIAPSKLKKIYTYKMEILDKEYNLENKTHFYWMSASQFNYCLEKYPSIKNKNHACGLGITQNYIRKILGEEGKLDIFLNLQDWKRHHTV